MDEELPINEQSRLSLPWRTVAFWSVGIAICVAVGSLGALVIVASVKGVDGLSTVALALAVLAFTSQIIVFVAQVFAANRQTARQEELYARMNGLLEGLKGTTDATQATMDKHMGVLLKAAVGEAKEVAQESSDDLDDGPKFNPVQFEQRVLERAREVAGHSSPSPFTFPPEPQKMSAEDESKLAQLLNYPKQTAQAEEAVGVLKELSPWAVQVLSGFGENERDALLRGRKPGIRKMREAPITQELVKHGLVELTGTSAPHLAQLTDKGRLVAGLIVPGARPPDWILERQAPAQRQG